MEQKNVERNLKLYAWYKLTIDPLFWGPVIITYIINVGKMSLSELYFMEGVVVLGLVFVEIYSSAWADLLGRKRAMILGSTLSFLAITLFSFADSPVYIWVSNVLIMVGFAIISGTDEAFLVDTLKEAGRSHELTKINGRIMARNFAIKAVTCVLAGYLYAINPRLPMFLSIPGVLASIVLALYLREPKTDKKINHREHFDLMKMSVLFVANHKVLKWVIVFMATIAIANKLWFFTYNPYFELVAISPEYYGWIFFALNICSWASSKYAHKVDKQIGDFKIILAIWIFTVASIFLMGSFVGMFGIVIVMLSGLSRGFTKPFFSSFINKHLDRENRATVLSIQSSVNALAAAISLWIFGLVLTEWSLVASLQILGLTIFVLGLFSVWRYKYVFAK